MKTKLFLATLVLLLGLTQPALADRQGVWGCPAMFSATTTDVVGAAIRVWNWSDGGALAIEEISIFDNSGTARPVTFSPVQLGPHQETAFVVQNLLGLSSTPGTRVFGIQVIVKWRATWGARPHAQVSWNVNSRDPVTLAMTGLTSTDTRECYDLK